MTILVVAGLSLSNRHPRVWDTQSPYYLPDLKAVMVSYADFDKSPASRKRAMEKGLHSYLGIPGNVKIYLDNGAFYFLTKGSGEVSRAEYEEFITNARPDWYVIPQDYIPSPKMSDLEQLTCLQKTMEVNYQYKYDGYVPVIHISRHLEEYIRQFQNEPKLLKKSYVGLGGIVPNLLRASKAMPFQDVLDQIRLIKSKLQLQKIHIFGIGGTATLHLAALLGIDSVDSSGWRNRAARGIIQLPGRGDRIVADLGNWRGRKLNRKEWQILGQCPCPACKTNGKKGLKLSGLTGFCNRATHNLWTLLKEADQIESHLKKKTYAKWYETHVENSTYRPLIDYLVNSETLGLR